jgi:CheY-like chemotaxis protein
VDSLSTGEANVAHGPRLALLSHSPRGFDASFTSRGPTLTCHALPIATVRGEMCAKRQVSGAPPKVLVVEDEPAVARMLRISLRAAGFDVVEAVAGREALQILEQEAADAVILDLELPDRRGKAVLDRLRQADDSGLPAWVVISGLDCEEATGRYGSLGGHFLAKPFDPWDLVRMLERILSERNGGQQ